MDKNQLQLIETPSNWRLDDDTKEIGREGLAHARSVLRATRATALSKTTADVADLTVDAPVERKAA